MWSGDRIIRPGEPTPRSHLRDGHHCESLLGVTTWLCLHQGTDLAGSTWVWDHEAEPGCWSVYDSFLARFFCCVLNSSDARSWVVLDCMALLVCFRSGPASRHIQLVKLRLQLYLYLMMGRMFVYMLGSPTHSGRLEQHFFNWSRVDQTCTHMIRMRRLHNHECFQILTSLVSLSPIRYSVPRES